MEQEIKKLQDRMDRHTHASSDNTSLLVKTSFVSITLPNTDPATAANYGIIFIATRPCFLKAVSEVHTTAGSSTPTLQIERLQGTQAPDAGTVLLATAFNLAATANTVQRGALIPLPTGLKLGDRLCLKDIGTLTAIAGLTITCEIQFI